MEHRYVPDINGLRDFASNSVDALYCISTFLEQALVSAAKYNKINIANEKEFQRKFGCLWNIPRCNRHIIKLKTLVSSSVEHSIGDDDYTDDIVYETVCKPKERKEPTVYSFWNRLTKHFVGPPSPNTKLWPVHTFDNESIKRFTMMKDAMVEHMKQHKKVFSKLPKQEKKHAEATAKVKKYEVRLQTASSALYYLTKKGETSRSRKRAVKKLEKALKFNQKIYDKINSKYEKIQEEEKELRQFLDELEELLKSDVQSTLTKSIEDILASIVRIICNGVYETQSQRSLELLDAATRFNLQDMMREIFQMYRVKLE